MRLIPIPGLQPEGVDLSLACQSRKAAKIGRGFLKKNAPCVIARGQRALGGVTSPLSPPSVVDLQFPPARFPGLKDTAFCLH